MTFCDEMLCHIVRCSDFCWYGVCESIGCIDGDWSLYTAQAQICVCLLAVFLMLEVSGGGYTKGSAGKVLEGLIVV